MTRVTKDSMGPQDCRGQEQPHPPCPRLLGNKPSAGARTQLPWGGAPGPQPSPPGLHSPPTPGPSSPPASAGAHQRQGGCLGLRWSQTVKKVTGQGARWADGGVKRTELKRNAIPASARRGRLIFLFLSFLVISFPFCISPLFSASQTSNLTPSPASPPALPGTPFPAPPHPLCPPPQEPELSHRRPPDHEKLHGTHRLPHGLCPELRGGQPLRRQGETVAPPPGLLRAELRGPGPLFCQ